MGSQRFTVNVESALAAAIREAAARAGISVSAWVAEAASAQLRRGRARGPGADDDDSGPSRTRDV